MNSERSATTELREFLDDIADLPYDQQIRYLSMSSGSHDVRRQRLARALLINELERDPIEVSLLAAPKVKTRM